MPQPSKRPRDTDAATDEDAGPIPCSPCRATGRVFANREGEQVSVTCPWCQGSGELTPGYDAQAAGIFPAA